MQGIAQQVAKARITMERSLAEAAKQLNIIGELQASCEHQLLFSRQHNAYHVTNWIVTYRCKICGIEHDITKEPVCESCDIPLIKCTEADPEAEQERQKPEYQGHYNPPIAYKCSKCNKIHILYILGD